MRRAVAAVWLIGCYSPAEQPGPVDSAVDEDVALADSCAQAACSSENTFIDCNGVEITCPHGCAAANPHCVRVRPSNGVAWSHVPAPAGALTLAAGEYSFDTDQGALAMDQNPMTLPGGVASATSGAFRVLAL